jgi:hypothetical protein
MRASTVLSFRLATDSSNVLAMRIVQVTSEARTSPHITIFTKKSADRNIDHGDSSYMFMKPRDLL